MPKDARQRVPTWHGRAALPRRQFHRITLVIGIKGVIKACRQGGVDRRPGIEAATGRESDLAKRAKGDPGKVKIAGRLRKEPLVTVKWIAERLPMGTASYVNNRLYGWRKGTLA